MTEETNSHRDAKPEIGEEQVHEQNTAGENDDDELFSASRRDLLRGSAAFAFSPLLGDVTGTTGIDRDAVTWTAQNRTVKGRRTDESDEAATSNPEMWFAAHATNTRLQYLGAQWERFGNPNSDAETNWHLRHTFALTSYSLALRPWGLEKDGRYYSAEGMDWVPAVKKDNLPDNVKEYLKKKHGNPESNSIADLRLMEEKTSTRAEFEIKTLQHSLLGETETKKPRQPPDSTDYTTHGDFFDGPPIVDDIALAVRRDSDLFGFAEPATFWRSAFENDESYLTEDGSVPPSVPILETLNNHVKDPMGAEYRDVVEYEANDRVDQVLEQRQDFEERAKLYDWFESSTGLALGIVGLGASGALVTGGGFALSIWGWLKATWSALDSEPAETPPYKGVYQSYSYDQNVESHPAAASFAMFDAYVSPDQSASMPGPDTSKPQFTVRVKHEASGGNPSLDEESIWVVTFDEQIPDGPDDDYDPASIHNAKILPPETARDRLENESSDDHYIPYDGGDEDDEDDEVVTFRPEPTFSIEPAKPTASEDEVTFDPRNTVLGGAPIEKYEWKLWKLTTYKDEPDANPQCQRKRVPLSNAGAERSIFTSEDEGVLTVEFSQPGRYEMEFTVWDEQGSSKDYSVRKFFEVEPNATKSNATEPLDLSVEITKEPHTVRVGEPVTFGATVTDEPAISDVVGSAFVGNLDDVKLYEWDVLQKYEQFRPTGGFTPAFDKQDKWLDPTYTYEFDEPGQYEVFVKVTDPITGADGKYSIPLTVIEEPSYELAVGDEPHLFDLVTDSITDTLTVRLESSESADFDIYASLDGRIPERHEYDKRSRDYGGDEQITFEADEVGTNPDVKLIVDAYSGKGNYALTVEDEPGAELEYLGGEGTPQDDDVSENTTDSPSEANDRF